MPLGSVVGEGQSSSDQWFEAPLQIELSFATLMILSDKKCSVCDFRLVTI